MIVNRSHLPWAGFVVVATVAAGVAYLANFHPDQLPFAVKLPAFFGRTPPLRGSVGGSPLGLLLGGASFLIFLFAAALGWRKKRPTLRIGRAQTWLRGHIWLTVLTLPLVLLHSGFSVGGPMTRLLLLLYALVMGSGFFGLALQQFIPRLMKERVPMETIFEQIPHIIGQMRAAAGDLRKSLEPVPPPAPEPAAAAAAATPGATVAPPEPAVVVAPAPSESALCLMEFLDEQALPYLAARRGDRLPLGDQRVADDQFRLLKLKVTEEHQERVERIRSWCDERRQLDLQTRIHHWLHGWLLLHIPASLLLLLLTAWHAAVTVFSY